MWAIISDIHGNLEALQAVLADIEQHRPERILCLGDIVGYGPDPVECLDLVMKHAEFSVLGNHDQGALFDPSGWSPAAERAIFWTREQLERRPPGGGDIADLRWEYLSNLPRTHREGDILFVHGSARNPVNEYVFPEDIYHQRKMESVFGAIERYCFQGHTHVPGIFLEAVPGDLYEFNSPDEIEFVHQLDGRKTMCNVGSVGQPRDGDPRACYVLLDGETIRFRRVPYDFETTRQKIHDNPELDDFLGDRLREGR
jgi:diadenosine tetraphosphatase ApaH/serine/threonine PP2A family protein phosphatase